MNRLTELKEKFKDKTVFIIGGGNSLSGFDFSRLENKCVIALNSAYKFVGKDAVLFWMDQSWGYKHQYELECHPSPYKFTSYHTKVDKGPAKSYPLIRTHSFGYDPRITHVCGNNAGTQALNFAVNLNPKRIVLLGYDMGYVDGKSHFHDYQTQTNENLYTSSFIPSIESLAKEISHIEVINCSKTTNLKCFKIGEVEDYL